MEFGMSPRVGHPRGPARSESPGRRWQRNPSPRSHAPANTEPYHAPATTETSEKPIPLQENSPALRLDLCASPVRHSSIVAQGALGDSCIVRSWNGRMQTCTCGAAAFHERERAHFSLQAEELNIRAARFDEMQREHEDTVSKDSKLRDDWLKTLQDLENTLRGKEIQLESQLHDLHARKVAFNEKHKKNSERMYSTRLHQDELAVKVEALLAREAAVDEKTTDYEQSMLELQKEKLLMEEGKRDLEIMEKRLCTILKATEDVKNKNEELVRDSRSAEMRAESVKQLAMELEEKSNLRNQRFEEEKKIFEESKDNYEKHQKRVSADLDEKMNLMLIEKENLNRRDEELRAYSASLEADRQALQDSYRSEQDQLNAERQKTEEHFEHERKLLETERGEIEGSYCHERRDIEEERARMEEWWEARKRIEKERMEEMRMETTTLTQRLEEKEAELVKMMTQLEDNEAAMRALVAELEEAKQTSLALCAKEKDVGRAEMRMMELEMAQQRVKLENELESERQRAQEKLRQAKVKQEKELTTMKARAQEELDEERYVLDKECKRVIEEREWVTKHKEEERARLLAEVEAECALKVQRINDDNAQLLVSIEKNHLLRAEIDCEGQKLRDERKQYEDDHSRALGKLKEERELMLAQFDSERAHLSKERSIFNEEREKHSTHATEEREAISTERLALQKRENEQRINDDNAQLLVSIEKNHLLRAEIDCEGQKLRDERKQYEDDHSRALGKLKEERELMLAQFDSERAHLSKERSIFNEEREKHSTHATEEREAISTERLALQKRENERALLVAQLDSESATLYASVEKERQKCIKMKTQLEEDKKALDAVHNAIRIERETIGNLKKEKNLLGTQMRDVLDAERKSQNALFEQERAQLKHDMTMEREELKASLKKEHTEKLEQLEHEKHLMEQAVADSRRHVEEECAKMKRQQEMESARAEEHRIALEKLFEEKKRMVAEEREKNEENVEQAMARVHEEKVNQEARESALRKRFVEEQQEMDERIQAVNQEITCTTGAQSAERDRLQQEWISIRCEHEQLEASIMQQRKRQNGLEEFAILLEERKKMLDCLEVREDAVAARELRVKDFQARFSEEDTIELQIFRENQHRLELEKDCVAFEREALREKERAIEDDRKASLEEIRRLTLRVREREEFVISRENEAEVNKKRAVLNSRFQKGSARNKLVGDEKENKCMNSEMVDS
eukprot:GEMP01006244.1.p1 GENE.GEMP01006244.1~~GEMP01006244.1.p1  ORF type:complete len:1214 (+),score=394.89 GEMP01006244.1:83-3724(+)